MWCNRARETHATLDAVAPAMREPTWATTGDPAPTCTGPRITRARVDDSWAGSPVTAHVIADD
eukprot:5099164-Pyramimonas_sp.AAC.1